MHSTSFSRKERYDDDSSEVDLSQEEALEQLLGNAYMESKERHCSTRYCCCEKPTYLHKVVDCRFSHAAHYLGNLDSP